VELLVLVDRKYSRDLPIQPNYVGIKVDTRTNDKVKVDWKENGKKDAVHIVTND
jgi:pyrimidine operon attenuation protein/uracil phosphoribosyltransferase